MAGLLDFLQTPQGQGLLSGLATYAANARRGTPINNVGRGLAGGLVGYQSAQDAIKQDQENAFNKQYKQSLIDQMAFNMTEAKRKQEDEKAFRESIKTNLKMGTPESASIPEQTFDYGFGKPDFPAPTTTPATPTTFNGMEIDPLTAVTLPYVGPEGIMRFNDAVSARKQRQADFEAGLEEKRTARQENLDFRRDQAEQQAALRRDLAAQASADRRMAFAQGNKPPAGYRYKPNGDLEMIPGGPADLKQQAKNEGGGTVDTVVSGLRDMYNQLNEAGGITSTKNKIGTNLGAGIASSGPGQMAGKLFGTENQSLRNTIAQQRPLLLQAIMKATGMSAKQMDSNAELKLYLSTATDPTLDVETNKRALDMIEKLYGSGAGNAPITGQQKSNQGGVKFLGFE